MKYLRLVSDVHLDFDFASFNDTRDYDPTSKLEKNIVLWGEMGVLWFPEPMEEDLETTFVIAGDLWTNRYFIDKKYSDGECWIQKLARRFKYVVMVLGNHDFWGQNLLYEAKQVKAELEALGLTNVFLLDNDMVVLDQVKFVGGVLWTDYNRRDPLVIEKVRRLFIKDFSRIRFGRESIACQPENVYEAHVNTKRYIFNNVKRDSKDQKVVVVTHTAPSYGSIGQEFRDFQHYHSNFHYYSELDERIRSKGGEIDLWFHGHSHRVADYTLSPGVRVCCQPRGYHGFENTKYDPLFRITL